MIQKSFFSIFDNFSERTFIGIEDVLDETIAPGFRFLKIFSYLLCFISILSTTASTIQSASLTTSKLSFIFPTLIFSICFLSINNGGLDLCILSFAAELISVLRSSRVTGTFALHS